MLHSLYWTLPKPKWNRVVQIIVWFSLSQESRMQGYGGWFVYIVLCGKHHHPFNEHDWQVTLFFYFLLFIFFSTGIKEIEKIQAPIKSVSIINRFLVAVFMVHDMISLCSWYKSISNSLYFSSFSYAGKSPSLNSNMLKWYANLNNLYSLHTLGI